jgi:hypothetical protein
MESIMKQENISVNLVSRLRKRGKAEKQKHKEIDMTLGIFGANY